MSKAEKSDPELWESVKERIKNGIKGGKPGQWSARKAQIATALYKKLGGGYIGEKRDDNSLKKWTEQDWQYVGKEKKSRYLPKKAIEELTPGEKAATSRAKNRGTKKGKQHVKQPPKIAKKTAKHRK